MTATIYSLLDILENGNLVVERVVRKMDAHSRAILEKPDEYYDELGQKVDEQWFRDEVRRVQIILVTYNEVGQLHALAIKE